MRDIPPEIWVRIFRICILYLSDWEEQRLTNADSRNSTIFNISRCFHPGAGNLALVCRRWANLVTNDNHLKFIKILALLRVGDEDEIWMKEAEEAVSSGPLCAIHIYLSVKLMPRFVRLLKTHSARIQLLALDSQALSRRQLEKLDSTIFPRLRYFSWSLWSNFDDREDLEVESSADDDDSLLSAFVKRHSNSLRFLWLDEWASSPVHVTNISYTITQLHLQLVNIHTPPPSLSFVCGLFRACPGLETLFLWTLERHSEYEMDVNLVSRDTPKMIASNLRECILSTNPILLLQILCYVSMPKLEALRVNNCTAKSRIHSHSLHLLSSVQFPSLIASFNPLGPLLARFFSIVTFSCLQELSVANDALSSDEFIRECNIFQHCNTLQFLHLRGWYDFQNLMLKNLACKSNASLWSLNLVPSPGFRYQLEAFEGVPTAFLGTIRSLELETHLSVTSHDITRILKELPNIETLAFIIRMPHRDFTPVISSLHSDLKDTPRDFLLPRLKTLKILLTDIWGRKQLFQEHCEQLEDCLRNRVANGHGLETLICNHSIVPEMAASMNQYVGAIVHGDKAEYSEHQYHVFRYHCSGDWL